MSQPISPTIGDRGEPFELVVEAGKIREFARATKARAANWAGPDAISPPTFLTADRFWAGRDSRVLARAAIDWSRVLHGEEEYTFHGPPPAAGQRLTAREEVVDVFAKAGRRGGDMKFVVVRTEYRDAAGDLVAEVRHTVIETSKAASDDRN
jgi:hypothetical protein